MHVRKTLEQIITFRPAHLTLIDPAKQPADRAGEVAATADELGTDGFLIGGSSGINQANLSATVNAVKKVTEKPVIFFPGQDKAYSLTFDATLFISLLNSRNVRYVVGVHAESAMLIKQLNIEVLPTGYLVIAPGMSVGEVGEANLIDRDDQWTACGYAAAAQLMGFKYLYLESGSGSPVSVPPEMVKAVKDTVEMPVIVGGGIRTAAVARQLLEAGADILVTGTVVERHEYKQRLSEILAVLQR
ncbi:geranylgeranylglyceryl/heptaprenylglyceryl phosphate synthase [Dethiobacter alkaliphilus]|uniref:geranylgeranylglyceryl/heptaprenylglyceryl phosphate synthase n=1 Tax=Dethiobacter alkaliphilus TaxID=427926 RepID=UPI002226BFDB|nr:geranylgeranylglyceryl/heptaprenylglyceryl phosphate synthase [Dethiobacter alkaliphilus]MCW3490630.1 geranylgeranylglyceryl/heptaprenylglyceryl phosphate synthase [Dethiobacter alkaliphilus]